MKRVKFKPDVFDKTVGLFLYIVAGILVAGGIIILLPGFGMIIAGVSIAWVADWLGMEDHYDG